MTIALALALLVSVALNIWLGVNELRRHRSDRAAGQGSRRILFPFLGAKLSEPALGAALRIARAEGATLVPAYLAEVPLSLNLETPLRRQAELALPLLEAIEQRALEAGVEVDSRIERGRTYRHAFRQLIHHETFDRVVAAGASNGDGFRADDVAWLLENAPGEVVILRPEKRQVREDSAAAA
jgi:hypothetical protein